MKKLFLASASPRRKELLELIGLDFEVVPSDYEEDLNLKNNPSETVRNLALGKARNVAKKVKEGIVIGSDTVVVLKGKILGKPKSKEEAKEILGNISDRELEVYSGVALVEAEADRFLTDCVVSKVKIKKLSKEEIENYVATGEPLDKAGAFGIQGRGALIVEKIEGDYFNIVGLPLFKLSEMLKTFGINCL